MKTILCATDYSESSVSALKFAKFLSDKLKADLVILHVYDIDTLVSPVSIAYARMQEEALAKHKAKLTAFCQDQLGTEPDGKKFRIVVDEHSLVWDGILEQREAVGAELIVIGTEGGSGLRRLLMGSTAKDLIHNASCPVLAVPPDALPTKIERMVYATAFEQADIYAIGKLVAQFARPLKIPLDLVHISTKGEYAGEDQMEWFKEMVQQQVDYENMSFQLQFSEDVFGSLADYITDVDAQLVAMLEREEQSFLRSLTHKDLVERMISKAGIPLLTFNKAHL
ncbi:universal stress protein [Flavobacteriaceae bacterium 3-367]|uniref:universal stress protein n=1 Tax=Eudoraea algarum TaxID=3417568 RepID=UPI003269F4C6